MINYIVNGSFRTHFCDSFKTTTNSKLQIAKNVIEFVVNNVMDIKMKLKFYQHYFGCAWSIITKLLVFL